MAWVTLAGYAQHAGVSAVRVTQYIKEGKLDGAWEMNEFGKKRIHVQKADEALRKSTQTWKQNEKKRADQSEETFKTPENDPKKPSYTEARTVRETFNAKITRLEYEEKLGKLVEADKVKVKAFEVARRVRDAILSIPDRVASSVAAETDEHKIHQLLSKEIEQALSELSNATQF